MKILLKLFCFAIMIVSFSGQSFAGGEHVFNGCDPKPYGLTECPEDINQFLQRAETCQYFGGEEPYDDARRAEIENAMKQAECEWQSCSFHTLMKKYEGQEKYTKMITDHLVLIKQSKDFDYKETCEQIEIRMKNAN